MLKFCSRVLCSLIFYKYNAFSKTIQVKNVYEDPGSSDLYYLGIALDSMTETDLIREQFLTLEQSDPWAMTNADQPLRTVRKDGHYPLMATFLMYKVCCGGSIPGPVLRELERRQRRSGRRNDKHRQNSEAYYCGLLWRAHAAV